MFENSLLALGSMVVLASSQPTCSAHKAPEINILPAQTKITFNYDKNMNELSGMPIDTLNPYGNSHATKAGGLMQGQIEAKYEMSFRTQDFYRLNKTCLYIDKIDVHLQFTPTIFIASDFPKASCMHRSIMTHEKEHVRIDQEIINKYARKIGYELLDTIKVAGSSYGPFPSNQTNTYKQRMAQTVKGVMDSMTNRMANERMIRQQAHDSFEEYQRVQARCR